MKKRNKLFVKLTAAILIICTLCSIASAADLTSAVKDSLPVEISAEDSVASFTLKNSGSEYYKYSVEVMDSDKETYLLCNNFEPNETAMVSGISAGLNYPLRLELYNPENVYFYEGSFSADAYGSVSASLSKVKTKANTENMSDEDIESLFEMTDKQYEKMFPSMDIPSFISEEEAKAAKHVKRLEEYENCYDRIGYKNADGSNTLYLFSSPVKYMDGSGKLCDAEPNICETDDSVKAEGYSHVNDYGELKTYFADSLSGSKGIKIQKKDSVLEFGFILPAQKETLLSKAASAVTDLLSKPKNKASLFTENREKKLEYAKVGKDADIISSPTTTGAVQTLILSDVPETNKITFRVNSNGTAPAVSEDRTSVSFIGDNGCGFKVGITEMRDSHEGTDPNNSVHFSMANYLRVTESTNGETLIEVTLDEDMLTCPATVYPVSIVLSADAVTADGSSAVPTAGTAPAGLRAAAQYTNDTISYNRFEDQTVYTNGAVGQAAAQYLIVGNNTFYRDPYYDEMHCSYNPGGYVQSEGVAFLKYNLSGLSIDPRLINYASLILTEASGNSSSVTTDVRRVTKLWAENDINFTHIYSYDSSSNGNLELTFSDSGTAHKYEALITYNLTSQLMYQHDNHEGVANYGLMIKSRTPSIYKHICSSEYAQTAHRPKVVVSYCDPLDLSETYSSQDYFSSLHNLRWYKFTPDKTDTYDIFTEGSADTYGVLYSSTLSPLARDNDSAQGYNFKMTYQLNAGVTYYIKVHRFSPQNYANGDYTIKVEIPNEIFFDNLDVLHQIADDYDNTREFNLTLQFLQSCNPDYQGAMWDTVAGEIDEQFVNHVKTVYSSLSNYFLTHPVVYDLRYGKVDFYHLCATMRGIIRGGGMYYQAIFIGKEAVRSLSGWAGDLQTLVIDTYNITNGADNYSLFYNTLYGIMGSSEYSFSMSDLLADVDAENFANDWANSIWGSDFSFGTACRYYYSNQNPPNTPYTSRCGTRFRQFFQGMTKDDFKSEVYRFTQQFPVDILITRVEWPLYKGKFSKDLTSNHSLAARDAFVNWMWEILAKDDVV